MKDISGWKIIPLCQFGAACRFWVALGLHDLIALVSKLEARRRMDGVINAAVAGTETAQQGGVCGVDDCIHLQTDNVPLPDGNLRIGGS